MCLGLRIYFFLFLWTDFFAHRVANSTLIACLILFVLSFIVLGLRFYSKIRITIQVIFMLSLIIILAYGEEFLWDTYINRSKSSYFDFITPYKVTALNSRITLSFAIAFLSIPQLSHYIIDGFIWKNNDSNPYLKPLLFPNAT